MIDQRASAAKIVTTTSFTSDRVAFAKGKPIRLVDSNVLLRLVRVRRAEILGLHKLSEVSEDKAALKLHSQFSESTTSKSVLTSRRNRNSGAA
jgi:hypothetical protein